MPYIIETDDSRDQTVSLDPGQQGITFKFVVAEAYDDLTLRAFVQTNITAFYAGLRFNNYTTKCLGTGVHEVEVHYGTASGSPGDSTGSKPTGFLSLSFDTGEDKIKLTQAYAQTSYPVPGRTAVNYRKAVGIKRENGVVKAEGVEVPSQAFNFTVTRTFNAEGALTGDLVGLLIATSWFVNNDEIDVTILGVDLSFAPGELLYKGATGSQKSGGATWEEGASWEGEVALKFGCQRNLVDITHPSGAEHVTKQGWDYGETIYEEYEQNNNFVPNPIQVNVSQIYPRTALGILFT